jgi:thiosulfate/3-mercaptopyruvate sulfurtransferase
MMLIGLAGVAREIVRLMRENMNHTSLFCLLVVLLLAPLDKSRSREINPIVSTDWLSQNLGSSKIALLDIRSAAQYAKGHIPDSINLPLSLWAISNDGLSLELPSDKDLQNLLGTSGINHSSTVVVVNRTETDFGRADATRAAWTCIIAGIENVAVLDGGYSKWVKENRAISIDASVPKPAAFSDTFNRSSVASKAYVLRKLGKSVIVDTRTPDDYFGISSTPGHIKGAVNLPAPWIFNSDGTFKKTEDLQAMAEGVIGAGRTKEIIVYCEVGGFSSAWWYLLNQVLGYQNVRVYDGSMEEWAKDPKAPISRFSWR